MIKYFLSIAVYVLFIFVLFSSCEEQKTQVEQKREAYYKQKIDSLEKRIKALNEQNRKPLSQMPDK